MNKKTAGHEDIRQARIDKLEQQVTKLQAEIEELKYKVVLLEENADWLFEIKRDK